MADSILSAEDFLKDLEGLTNQTEPSHALWVEQVGTSSEFVFRTTSDPAYASAQRALPLHVLPFDVDALLDPVQELASFTEQLRLEHFYNPLPDRIGRIELDVASQPLDFAVSRSTRDIDLVFDYSTGKVIGISEVPIAQASSDSSSSLQREYGAGKDFVRGSSTNAPFLPGGVDKLLADREARSQKRKLQRDVAQYANITTSPLFDFSNVSPFLPSHNVGVQFDADDVPQVVTKDSAPTQDQRLAAVLDDPFALLPQPPSVGAETSEPLAKDASYYRQIKKDRGEERYLRGQRLEQLREVVKDSDDVISRSSKPLAQSSEKVAVPSKSSLLTGATLDSELSGKAWLQAAKEFGAARAQAGTGATEYAVTERMVNIAVDFADLVPDPAIIYPFEMDEFQKEAAYHLEQGESVFIAAHTSAGKTVVAEYAIALAMKHMTRAIYTSPIKALSNQKYRDFKDTFGDDVGLITGDVSVNSDAACLIVTTEILRSMLYKGADLIRDVEWVIFDEVHYINDLERGVVWEEVIIMLPDHVGLIFLSATVPNTAEFAEWVGRTKRRKVFVIRTDKRPVPLEHYLYFDKQVYKMFDAKEGYLSSGLASVNNAIRTKKERKAEKAKAAGKKPASSNVVQKGGVKMGEWSNIVAMLSNKNLLPAVCFVFSKNKCMDLAQSLGHIDLTSTSDKNHIKRFINESIKRLKGTDRQLPQVLVMTELLTRGIGVHHSGLLPIVKEIVEILFSTGLIKVLFATETFAMGVNMPTRTVVFHSIRKFDGRAPRDLLPGEYIQMSGRAGRRGLDTVGTVIVVTSDEPPEGLALKTMVTGRATRLSSQFRLTYNMILNLLKMGGDFKIEDMIKRSFFESSNQKDTAILKERLKVGKAQLKDIEDIICVKPSPETAPSPAPITDYYDLVFQERAIAKSMHQWLVKSSYIGEMFPSGRVIVVNVAGLPRHSLAAVIRPPGGITNNSNKAALKVLVQTGSAGRRLSDKYKVVVVDPTSPSQVEFVTTKKLKKVDAESVDVAPDDNHISQLLAELDSIRIEALPNLPPAFDPIKHLKVKDIEFISLVDEIALIRELIAQHTCHGCDLRGEHFAKHEHNVKLREQVSALEFLLSDQNLLMIPEYESRVRVLKHLGFVSASGVVQVKGRVARELNNCDELIATELIFQNLFTDMPPDEIVALLSCFVFQERSDNEPNIPPSLKPLSKFLIDLATRLGELQVDLGVPLTPQEFVEENINPGLMEVVYEWAHQKPFHEIVRLTDVPEGSIVRAIVRLDETLRDFRSAAKLIGNVDLALKMEEASQLIKRDIVFASSLYIADAPQQRPSGDGTAVVEE